MRQGRRRKHLSSYTASLKVIAFSLQQRVQHLAFLLLWHKHVLLGGDLSARGAIENCLLRDAALMSSACVPEAIRRRAAGWRPEVFAALPERL